MLATFNRMNVWINDKNNNNKSKYFLSFFFFGFLFSSLKNWTIFLYIYLTLNFISNVFISHSITDVSSDPVKRYCDCCGTIIDVTAPLWPKVLPTKNERRKKERKWDKITNDTKMKSISNQVEDVKIYESVCVWWIEYQNPN